MAEDKSIMEILGRKLELDTKVSIKASEICRLLQVRACSTSLTALRLSGSCQHVICLDLAAKTLGSTVNKVNAARLSGMNKKSYTEAVKMIASMLGLDERLTIRDLAVQFGCTGAVSLAGDILNRYVADQCGDMDFSSPMFLCAAIFVACRKLKLKINLSRLREVSGVKKVTLTNLIAQMDKYTESVAGIEKKPKTTSRKRSLLESVEAQIEDNENVKKRKKEDTLLHNGQTAAESYEEWKSRILAGVSKEVVGSKD